jgi:glycerophosphoryl diester phosphodiesterase
MLGLVTRYGADAGPLPVAHRGGAGLAPENSLSAFDRSYALGFRYLETDLRVTADGVCVAFHDRSLRRVLATPGTVRATTWDRLRRLRFQGQVVPTLDDLLTAYPDARLMMDLKDPAALAPVVETLRRHRALGRVCLAGASDRLLAAARAAGGPGLSTALGLESVIRLACAARAGAGRARLAGSFPAAEFVHVPLTYRMLPVYSRRLVEMAHDLGLRVMTWTVDDAGPMARLLDDGVDGVITDRPDVLREVLIARDAWNAPAAVPSVPSVPSVPGLSSTLGGCSGSAAPGASSSTAPPRPTATWSSTTTAASSTSPAPAPVTPATRASSTWTPAAASSRPD